MSLGTAHKNKLNCFQVFYRRKSNIPNFDRITQNPGILSGKPCIRGLRISVDMIVSELAAGQTIEGMLDDFPYLKREYITQALLHHAAAHSTPPLA